VSATHAEVQRRRQLLTADPRKERDRHEGDRQEKQRGEYQENGLAVTDDGQQLPMVRLNGRDLQNIIALLALSTEVPTGALACPALSRPALLGRVAD
jgi:hypothetical protein